MTAPASIDIDRFLAQDPAVYGGEVTIRGRRLPASRLGLDHVYEGVSPAELSRRWDLSLAEVHAALSYFFAHRDEIEQYLAEYDAETDRIIAAEREATARK